MCAVMAWCSCLHLEERSRRDWLLFLVLIKSVFLLPLSVSMSHVCVLQVTIAYPDEGAWKRFHYQFKDEGYPEVICTKVRDGAKRIVRLKVRARQTGADMRLIGVDLWVGIAWTGVFVSAYRGLLQLLHGEARG